MSAELRMLDYMVLLSCVFLVARYRAAGSWWFRYQVASTLLTGVGALAALYYDSGLLCLSSLALLSWFTLVPRLLRRRLDWAASGDGGIAGAVARRLLPLCLPGPPGRFVCSVVDARLAASRGDMNSLDDLLAGMDECDFPPSMRSIVVLAKARILAAAGLWGRVLELTDALSSGGAEPCGDEPRFMNESRDIDERETLEVLGIWRALALVRTGAVEQGLSLACETMSGASNAELLRGGAAVVLERALAARRHSAEEPGGVADGEWSKGSGEGGEIPVVPQLSDTGGAARRLALLIEARADDSCEGSRTSGARAVHWLCLVLAACWLGQYLFFDGPPGADLVAQGAFVPSMVWAGEYWRLVTPVFLHAGILHLGFNCLGLLLFGPRVQAVLGTPAFLFVFFFTGICGYAAGMWEHTVLAVGASGGVMGIMGATMTILYMGLWPEGPERARVFLKELVVLVVVNLLIGHVEARVFNVAHIGGLLAGGFATWCILGFRRYLSSRSRNVFQAVSLLMVFGMAAYAFLGALPGWLAWRPIPCARQRMSHSLAVEIPVYWIVERDEHVIRAYGPDGERVLFWCDRNGPVPLNGMILGFARRMYETTRSGEIVKKTSRMRIERNGRRVAWSVSCLDGSCFECMITGTRVRGRTLLAFVSSPAGIAGETFRLFLKMVGSAR